MCSGLSARGVPFFFVRVDPAGMCRPAVFGGSISVRALSRQLPALESIFTAFATPGVVRVQVAELPDGFTD